MFYFVLPPIQDASISLADRYVKVFRLQRDPATSQSQYARDIELFQELDLDMIGVGPYIAHPETPLGGGEIDCRIDEGDQVPGTAEMTCKVVALARIVQPDANIPATTALATIDKLTGREKGLRRGANVIMPNLTPLQYRKLYEIYPEKACFNETAEACESNFRNQIALLGRKIGSGPGGRVHVSQRLI